MKQLAILFELTVQRGLAYPKHVGGEHLVTVSHLQNLLDGPAFESL